MVIGADLMKSFKFHRPMTLGKVFTLGVSRLFPKDELSLIIVRGGGEDYNTISFAALMILLRR